MGMVSNFVKAEIEATKVWNRAGLQFIKETIIEPKGLGVKILCMSSLATMAGLAYLGYPRYIRGCYKIGEKIGAVVAKEIAALEAHQQDWMRARIREVLIERKIGTDLDDHMVDIPDDAEKADAASTEDPLQKMGWGTLSGQPQTTDKTDSSNLK